MSGLGTTNVGKMKGRHLTLGKGLWLYRSKFHGKLLKAPKLVLSKVCQGVLFYIIIYGPKSKYFLFNSP